MVKRSLFLGLFFLHRRRVKIQLSCFHLPQKPKKRTSICSKNAKTTFFRKFFAANFRSICSWLQMKFFVFFWFLLQIEANFRSICRKNTKTDFKFFSFFLLKHSIVFGRTGHIRYIFSFSFYFLAITS